MKILYDYQMFSLQKYGGITKYFTELIRNIPPEHQCKIALFFSDNNYLREDREFFKKWKIPVPRMEFKGKRFVKDQVHALNQWYSRRSIAGGDYDLFHPTFYDDYFFPLLKKPYIITVHDLIDFKFEATVYKDRSIRQQMERVIRNANRIIAISHNTKRDIVEAFNILPDKIDVIYHGYNNTGVNNGVNEFGRYILFVGLRKRYKNFTLCAKALSTLLNTEKDIKLICVGGPFSDEEMTLLRELKIEKQAIAIHVTEKKLNQLYANALVFVYPSLYEGFGMPILEAFANNCPVCLSDASSFPEVAGEAGVYFDPNDTGSILEAVEKVIYDSDFRREKVTAGKERLIGFSWEKTARETVSAYLKTT
jgi:glycosyltransferase involved in cell wall biosynthesis